LKLSCGNTSCEITLHTNEIKTVEFIREIFGINLLNRSNIRAVRYHLHRTDCMID